MTLRVLGDGNGPLVSANAIRPTTGAPAATASDQSGDFAYDALAQTIYGPFSGNGVTGTWPVGEWLGGGAVAGGVPTSGCYLVTPNTGSTSTAALSTQTVSMVPVCVKETQTFTGLSTYMTVEAVGATSPLCVMGVYNDGGSGRPMGAPIAGSTVTFNPTATAASANIDIAFATPITLAPGIYYLALALTFTGTFGTNPTFVTMTPIGNTWLPSGTTSLGNSSLKGWQNSTGGPGVLPTLTAPFQGSGSLPIVALKAQ